MNKKAPALLLFLCLLCLCLPTPGKAERVCQARVVKLEPILITADRLPQPIAKSTSSATLITREEIARKHPALPDDILRGRPGLCVNSSGTVGETASIRLRGSNSYQTLVLIDSMKVNSPWNGAYGEWGNTELADIGRIEVIRGAQSELYGSEAMGGVVHLITKEGRQAPGFALSLGGGNFETRKESLELAAGGKSINYLLSAAQINSQGQFDNDAHRGTRALPPELTGRPLRPFPSRRSAATGILKRGRS